MTKYCSFLITLIFFYLISLSYALNNGFSVEIIHRDSSKPPLQRVANAIRRSINHANYYNNLNNVNGSPQTSVIPDKGEYLMSYSIGTPPFKLYGIIDTGNDILWFQCKPCDPCYNQTSPIFDPSKSTTYKTIPCASAKCQYLPFAHCSGSRTHPDDCEYFLTYGDGSQTRGDLSLDTLTLNSTDGSAITFPNTMVGCSHSSSGTFGGTFGGQASGIIGLSSDNASFISQLNSSINGKFSYCLVPFYLGSNSSSKLNFGDAAVVSGNGTISTPIFHMPGRIINGVYYLSLEAFSVGNQWINFPNSSKEDTFEGNTVIELGTTVTLLPANVYSRLESAVAKLVKYERVDDPTKQLGLCYKTTSQKLDFPVITAHFKGGDVQLNSINTFIPVADEIQCFAFVPVDDDYTSTAMLGNVAQQNFLVGYDLQKNTLSFKPTDCTLH